MSNNETQVKNGDRVRITETFFSQDAKQRGYEDAHPGLIGAVGTVVDFPAGGRSVRLRLDERVEGWNELYVPAGGVEHYEEEEGKFKVGDRVRIVSSKYTEHPSRKAGGTGTIDKFLDGDLCHVRVDNDP